jgi:hypothetical protein
VAPFVAVFTSGSGGVLTESISIPASTFVPGSLYIASVEAVNATQNSANKATKSFVSGGGPAKYASFLASTGLTLSGATSNITAWADQSGNARSVSSPAAANFPLKTLNAAGTSVVRMTTGAQGFTDAVNQRLLPRNSDYTKMVVFQHNATAEITSGNANYFSAYGANTTSLLWRNGTTTIIANTNFTTATSSNEIQSLPIVAGRWYAVFVVFNNTAKTQTMYFNNLAGSVTTIGSSINAQPLTVDGGCGIGALADMSSGGLADYLEVATWNVALTNGQCAGAVARLASTYPTLVF